MIFDKDEVPALYNEFGAKFRLHGRSLDGLPMLDSLLPVFEYSPEKLMASPFGDAWLVSALKMDGLLRQAAELLKPLGIGREDLMLILHSHMKQRLKEQKMKRNVSRP